MKILKLYNQYRYNEPKLNLELYCNVRALSTNQIKVLKSVNLNILKRLVLTRYYNAVQQNTTRSEWS